MSKTQYRFVLKVSLCGNPDHGQNPLFPPFGLKRENTIKAHNVQGIRDAVRHFQAENKLGGGNWESAYLFDDGLLIGRMSWNCRVWSIQVPDKELVL